MRHSFNLVREPWIPCIGRSGETLHVSLQDALLNAHALQEVYDESPLVTVALYRLLLANLHRVFGPENRRAWHALWQGERWPAEPVQTYLRRWEERFDLFHPDRPFFQAKDDRVKPRSVIHLIHSLGNNPTLFSHEHDGAGIVLSVAEAARQLVAAQAFRSAGLSGLEQKFTDGPCTRGIVFLVRGNNLFETLALNLIPYPDDSWFFHTTGDKPAWEMDNPFQPARTRPLGYLDYLTWQSSRIWLLPEARPEGIVVREATIAPALRLDESVLDPMKHHRADKKAGYKVLRFSEERALWRDSAALLEINRQTEDKKDKPPAVISWLASLIYNEYLEKTRRYQLMALGMASYQAKVFFYRAERMPLPLAYLSDVTLVEQLRDGLALAEAVQGQLYGALSRLATLLISPESDQEGGRQPLQGDITNLVNHWGTIRHYWGNLEPAFARMVIDLPSDPEGAIAVWREELRRAARNALERATALAGTGSAALKAAVRARGQLEVGLRKVLESSVKQEEQA